jgi:FdhE protein
VSFTGLFLRFWRYNLWGRSDSLWMRHIGDVVTQHEENVPEVGRYNAGQKIVFWGMTILLLVLAASGIVMWDARFGQHFTIEQKRIAAVVHAAAAVVTIGLWIVHVYAAIWVKGTNDPRLGDWRLGMEAPPQVAARGGRQRAEMSVAGRIAEPVDIGRVANPPLVRPPDRSQVFRRQAGRFDRLAAGSTIADFLSFMAAIAAAQSAALASLPALVGPEALLSYSTPPFDRRNWQPDASWRDTLIMICNRLTAQPLTVQTRAALERLVRLDADALDRLAEAALFLEIGEAERAAGCLAFAALQVHWTRLAGLIDATGFQALDRPGACPVCASPPVASLVHSNGSLAGLRFLVHALCATEWHLVRIKCSSCTSTEGIAYFEIEGAGGLVKAETCDQCRTYSKIVFAEKDADAEVFADDLVDQI